MSKIINQIKAYSSYQAGQNIVIKISKNKENRKWIHTKLEM